MGSSTSSTAGSFIKALAMLIRWRCPPESWWGRFPACPLRPTDSSSSSARFEVLQLVADGHSNLQISQQLFLSQATVKSHLAHVYTKLGVDSRTAAVAAATTRGLIRR